MVAVTSKVVSLCEGRQERDAVFQVVCTQAHVLRDMEHKVGRTGNAGLYTSIDVGGGLDGLPAKLNIEIFTSCDQDSLFVLVLFMFHFSVVLGAGCRISM